MLRVTSRIFNYLCFLYFTGCITNCIYSWHSPPPVFFNTFFCRSLLVLLNLLLAFITSRNLNYLCFLLSLSDCISVFIPGIHRLYSLNVVTASTFPFTAPLCAVPIPSLSVCCFQGTRLFVGEIRTLVPDKLYHWRVKAGCPSAYLYLHLSISTYINLSISSYAIYLYLHISIYIYLYLSVYLSAYLSSMHNIYVTDLYIYICHTVSHIQPAHENYKQ